MTTIVATMTIRKTAIAVPEDLLREVDAAASARGESRSRFINHVLRAAVRSRRDADITRRLDRIFGAESAATSLSREAADLDRDGDGWDDERW
jgi:metal-responsive CopG/Arc/MetJ family transcriptional regulator